MPARVALRVPVTTTRLPRCAGSGRPSGTGGLSRSAGRRRDLAAARAGAAGVDTASRAGTRMLAAAARSARLIPFLLLVLVVRAAGGASPRSGASVLLRGLATTHGRGGSGLGSAVALRGAAGLVFAGTRGAAACFRVIRHRIAPE